MNKVQLFHSRISIEDLQTQIDEWVINRRKAERHETIKYEIVSTNIQIHVCHDYYADSAPPRICNTWHEWTASIVCKLNDDSDSEDSNLATLKDDEQFYERLREQTKVVRDVSIDPQCKERLYFCVRCGAQPGSICGNTPVTITTTADGSNIHLDLCDCNKTGNYIHARHEFEANTCERCRKPLLEKEIN